MIFICFSRFLFGFFTIFIWFSRFLFVFFQDFYLDFYDFICFLVIFICFFSRFVFGFSRFLFVFSRFLFVFSRFLFVFFLQETDIFLHRINRQVFVVDTDSFLRGWNWNILYTYTKKIDSVSKLYFGQYLLFSERCYMFRHIHKSRRQEQTRDTLWTIKNVTRKYSRENVPRVHLLAQPTGMCHRKFRYIKLDGCQNYKNWNALKDVNGWGVWMLNCWCITWPVSF